MKPYPVDIFALKSNEERPKCVNPGKGPFNGKTILIDFSIKVALSTAFRRLSATFVFRNVGFDAIVPEPFAYHLRIKACIRVEDRTLIVE